MLKSYLIVLIVFFNFTFIPIFPNSHPKADIKRIKIKGEYNAVDNVFNGSAEYLVKSHLLDTLEFHLPANRNSHPDWRKQFQFEDSEGLLTTYDRSDLGELKKYHLRNPHLPESIDVFEIRIDGKRVHFETTDNSTLSPLLNTRSSMAVISIDKAKLSRESSKLIEIRFITKFNNISEDWVKIIWDFIPRPVASIDGATDYSDHWSELRQYFYSIQVTDTSEELENTYLEGSSQSTIPVVILNSDVTADDDLKLTLDEYLEDDRKFFTSRFKKVQRFLIENNWLIEDDLDQHIAVWSGPLSVTGSHIMLPHRLVRYNSIYYKTFEVVLLRAFIRSALLRRYSLNPVQYPWIEPAIDSEIIRDYFKKEYSGDTSYFPWGQWLNPDFNQENTIKTWLDAPGKKRMISGSENKDLRFLSNVYHPWYEKGFHLFRTIAKNNQEFNLKFYPNLKRLLQQKENSFSHLDRTSFYDFFNLTPEQEKKADGWLLRDVYVDYEIQDVEIKKKGDQSDVIVSIASHGSLAPPFEINFVLQNGLSISQEIVSGATTYEFSFPSPPTEIVLDPSHKLLENNVLNNYWYTPFKIRPIWDFPSASSWIATVSPVINGNTFDKNLFGLSVGVRYLNQTEFYISGWRSDSDEQILWESTLVHFGFPWHGSELYFESSELNASISKTVGYRHNYAEIHKHFWFSVDLMEETLDQLEEDTSSDNETWQSVEGKLSFPLYVGNFTDSVINLSGSYGKNTEEATNDFQRQGIFSRSVWYLGDWKVHLELSSDHSSGLLPLQKKYPIGGPEALPGFPREEDLLYDQRSIAGFGITLPPYLTHTNINALRLGWLERIETTLFMHWAEANTDEMEEAETFRDVELRFNLTISWLNMFEGDGVIAIAQPLENEKYKDYRLILFSNWVF